MGTVGSFVTILIDHDLPLTDGRHPAKFAEGIGGLRIDLVIFLRLVPELGITILIAVIDFGCRALYAVGGNRLVHIAGGVNRAGRRGLILRTAVRGVLGCIIFKLAEVDI